MFGDISPTPLDLRFRLFGFPVRVHPLFWLVMALLGNWTFNDPVLGPAAILLWVACGFVSILWHELGHAFAARWFGSPVQVILTAFGGLAVYPYSPPAGWRRMVIAAAGPIAGFILLGLVYGSNEASDWALRSPVLRRVYFYLFVMNLFWNLINLLPIWPLDGGKVLREVFYIAGLRRPDPATYAVSLVTSGLLAAYGVLLYLRMDTGWLAKVVPAILAPGPFMTLWFVLFAVQSYQLLQQSNRQSAWDDPDDDRLPWQRR